MSGSCRQDTAPAPPLVAQHAHHAVAKAKTAGPYKAQALTEHEYATLRRVADLIIPADSTSKGALDAGAPEFIDFLCSRNDDLKAIFRYLQSIAPIRNKVPSPIEPAE